MQIGQTVAEVAALVGGRVEGAAGLRLEALCALGAAGPADLAAVFRDGPVALKGAEAAGCLLLRDDLVLPEGLAPAALIRVPDPDAAVDRIVLELGRVEAPAAAGVHATAVVEAGAEVDASASLGPWVHVGPGARVGPRCRLAAGVVLGAGASLGADCVLAPHVVVGHHCRVGQRVLLHAGAVLGADGFGYRQDRQGHPVKVPQRGTVVVGDDVEIGANTTIDRARFDATVIGDGTKLDDLVHVGHNVRVGRNCMVAGNCALAGRVTLEDDVVMGGTSGAVGGVTLGRGTRVGGLTMVTQDTPPGAEVVGSPARPRQAWVREVLSLRRLPALLARLREARPGEGERGA